MNTDRPQIDLIWFGEEAPDWEWGRCWCSDTTPQAVKQLWDTQLNQSNADYLMFWDSKLELPDEQLLKSLLQRNVDVWHAGLRLGMSGLPGILDFSKPTWMFNRDPASDIEVSSWRLSLKVCLLRAIVPKELGFVNPCFKSLDVASLELGYRYLQQGAILRHRPDLIQNTENIEQPLLSYVDEMRFAHLTQRRWVRYWTITRTLLSGYVSPLTAFTAFRKVRKIEAKTHETYTSNQIPIENIVLTETDFKVTVLIPTLDRYPYLRQLLDQLRSQTIPPIEIIIIDQTEREQYDDKIEVDFCDLPLQIIYQDNPGQCSSRNAGLMVAKGDYVLFVDDDDEVGPDLIERHLKNLQYFQADTSSGGVNEVGALPLSDVFMRTGMSNVFPTNNTLIRKDVLRRSGLFDMAYNHGQSADADLGTRIYLAGALMIYNPQITVLHHRAPRGGLRRHKARVITYSSSRTKLFHRRFPHVTECYRMRRYFSARQVHESLWLTAAGTFSIRGGLFKKLLKILVALVLLPNTVYHLKRRLRAAGKMLIKYPQIPEVLD